MRRRRLLLAAVAALTAIGAVGVAPGSGTASPAAPAFPPQRPTRVLVLGDSVMKGAANDYAPALPGREVIVSAEVNRSTGQGADELAKLGTDWDVVVVLLGHNDGGSPGAYQPAARRILDQLRDVRVVSWLTIHEVRPYYPGVNQYIAGLQGEYPNLIVGDWNAVANANPGALAGDGLHLNGQGAQLMAETVAEQVEIAEIDWALALRRLAQATTTTTSTTTTTTAPPTTTTTEVTTTTEAATTTEQATTTEAPAAIADVEAVADGEESGAGAAVIAGIGAAVLVAVLAGALVLRRRRRRGPDA